MTPTSTTAAHSASASRTWAPLLRNLQKKLISAEPYRERVKLAREAAEAGHGHEDLVVTFNISERDARHIVFGK